jgi:hypothetical protein
MFCAIDKLFCSSVGASDRLVSLVRVIGIPNLVSFICIGAGFGSIDDNSSDVMYCRTSSEEFTTVAALMSSEENKLRSKLSLDTEPPRESTAPVCMRAVMACTSVAVIDLIISEGSVASPGEVLFFVGDPIVLLVIWCLGWRAGT